MSIGEKIKSLRVQNNLTQRELADEINFSHSYIGDLENNRTNPSIKTLEVIANYFELETTYFLEKSCCYIKFLNGEKDFCRCKEEVAKSCPFRI